MKFSARSRRPHTTTPPTFPAGLTLYLSVSSIPRALLLHAGISLYGGSAPAPPALPPSSSSGALYGKGGGAHAPALPLSRRGGDEGGGAAGTPAFERARRSASGGALHAEGHVPPAPSPPPPAAAHAAVHAAGDLDTRSYLTLELTRAEACW